MKNTILWENRHSCGQVGILNENKLTSLMKISFPDETYISDSSNYQPCSDKKKTSLWKLIIFKKISLFGENYHPR